VSKIISSGKTNEERREEFKGRVKELYTQLKAWLGTEYQIRDGNTGVDRNDSNHGFNLSTLILEKDSTELVVIKPIDSYASIHCGKVSFEEIVPPGTYPDNRLRRDLLCKKVNNIGTEFQWRWDDGREGILLTEENVKKKIAEIIRKW